MVKRFHPDHPVVGVGAIILKQGNILLEKRGNEPAKGKWSIPGGVVEIGEHLEDAVLRETLEETGLAGENPQLIDVVDQVQMDSKGTIAYHYVIIDYSVTVKQGEPKAASDAEELRWVPVDEVETYDLTLSFRRFFIKNMDTLKRLSLS